MRQTLKSPAYALKVIFKFITGKATSTQQINIVRYSKLRSRHGGDRLKHREVRYERKSDIVLNLNNDPLLILAKKAVNPDQ